jgi:LDH2 family malate/lactate/ureidoglycolate dehydrogenase
MSEISTTDSSRTSHHVSVAALHEFCAEAFRRAGLSADDAATGAEVLATTDAWGIFTHGSKSLAGYLRRLKGGGLRAQARPTVIAEGPAWAVVDGQSALGMVTSVLAMQTAIGKARTQGIAYVGVRNSCHFGAAGYYAWLAAREGFIGLAMANDIPSVTAPGARGRVTGSNPLAYAVPAGRHPPLLLDIAASVVAGGKVAAAHARGEQIPEGWVIGTNGRPTTDPAQFLAGGALLPFAGHKGYGLALLIETLSGLLTGAAVTWGIRAWMSDDPGLATGHGAAFLALDVNTITPGEDFRRRVDQLIDEIHAAPKVEGSNRVYVPGEREWEHHRQAMVEGIDLPPDVWARLRAAAELSGTDFTRLRCTDSEKKPGGKT